MDSSAAVRGILGAVSRPEWIEDPQELKRLAAFKDDTKLVAIFSDVGNRSDTPAQRAIAYPFGKFPDASQILPATQCPM